MPTPRFAPQLRATPPTNVSPENGGRAYTDEVVELDSGGGYLIRGIRTPTRATLIVDAGDLVSVLWKDSKPFMIMDVMSHHGSGTDEAFGGKLVEELLIANDANGQLQVWFRSATVIANLKLRKDWGADPDQVRWGTRADSFFVRVGFKYFVYKFARPGGIDVPLANAPKPKLLRAEQPWDTNMLLSTVTYAATQTFDTPCISNVDVINDSRDNPRGFDEVVHEDRNTTVAEVSALVRGDSVTTTSQFRITKGLIDGTDGVPKIHIHDAALDWKYNLVLSLRVLLTDDRCVLRPSTTTNGNVATKSWLHVESPIGTVITDVGDPTAADGQPDLDGAAYSHWVAADPDGDFYAIIANVTQQKIVWSTLKPIAAFAMDREGTSEIGLASFVNLTSINIHVPPYNNDEQQKSASQGPSGSVIVPHSATPPTDPAGVTLVDIHLTKKNTGARRAFDPDALAAVGYTDADLVSSFVQNTLYGDTTGYRIGSYSVNAPSGNIGPLIPTLPNSALRGIYDGSNEWRPLQLFFYPVRYLPHRTKDLGDVLLFVVRQNYALDGSQSVTFQNAQHSFWRYSVDTKKSKMFSPWTTFATFTAGPVILGATLKHVLWMLRIDNGSASQWSIILSDMDHAINKLLVQDTGSAFTSTPPPLVQAVLSHMWELLRPDLLYMLDDPDKKISTKFLTGWTKDKVTLDLTKPLVTDTALIGKGDLKKLPTGLTPIGRPDPVDLNTVALSDGTPKPDREPSVRSLESSSALRGRFLKDL